MEFINKEIQAYADAITAAEPEVLSSLNKETYLQILYPRMLSGHWQGRMLAFFSQLVRPRYVLEIGTYTGYSCLCFAEGLQENGKIITIDINPELGLMIDKYLSLQGIREKVDVRFGDAMEIIPTLNVEFDLVFIDADKGNYLNYYEMVLPKVKKGGLILADNVLWSGKVLDIQTYNDKETTALHAFNDFVSQDSRVECVLFPVRDGVLAIRKK